MFKTILPVVLLIAVNCIVDVRKSAPILLDKNPKNQTLAIDAANATVLPVNASLVVPGVTTSNSSGTSTPVSPANVSRIDGNSKTTFKVVYSAGDFQSRLLIAEGLAPLFTRSDILKVAELDLIPYANTVDIPITSLSTAFLYWHPELQKSNISHVYRCSNGEQECESNLIHACAVNVSNNRPNEYMPFLACMASAPSSTAPEDSSFACANSTSFMDGLRSCALGPAGVELQRLMVDQSLGKKIVPAIYIDGEEHSFNVTKTVLKDLTTLVCDTLLASGKMNRDSCESKGSDIGAPFESLLAPSKNTGHAVRGSSK